MNLAYTDGSFLSNVFYTYRGSYFKYPVNIVKLRGICYTNRKSGKSNYTFIERGIELIDKGNFKTITFWLGGMLFEYDEWKNEYNIMHPGISFKQAARVFFDYDRIELFDEENSDIEDRYDTIGDLAAGYMNTRMSGETIIGSTGFLSDKVNDIVFVVYTERAQTNDDGKRIDVTRLISARLATDFERGLYYGKY